MIKIPHSRPLFGQPFGDAALKVIQSGFLAQGQENSYDSYNQASLDE